MSTMAAPAALERSLASIAPAMSTVKIPRGAFDPAGAWQLRYRQWQVIPAPAGGMGGGPGGALILDRKPVADGLQFDVDATVNFAGSRQRTKARITAAADRLGTPRRFSVQTWTEAKDAFKVPGTELSFTGRADKDRVVFQDANKAPVKPGSPWTLDYTLLDAIQRMANLESIDVRFNLIEDFDLLRPNQRLLYCGRHKTTLGGQSVELGGLLLLGTGVLPTHYWLDQRQRVVFVIGARRAFILDEGVA